MVEEVTTVPNTQAMEIVKNVTRGIILIQTIIAKHFLTIVFQQMNTVTVLLVRVDITWGTIILAKSCLQIVQW